jgi:peptidoglycan/xylan/chitin deacetylase (PgdA/CDA1 family)
MRRISRMSVPSTLALSALVLSARFISAQVPQGQSPTAIPGWKWTMDSVRKTVGAVRAGRDLQPRAWPNGKKVAVLLSFDADNETVTLRFGETSIGALSMGQYGARAGLPRVLKLLDERKIPASFFIPSVSLELHPEMAKQIGASGRHEFGIHGWIHEMNVTLSEADERALLVRAIADVTRITGKKPTGYRAPSWNFSPNTLSIIRDLGFRYESSLMADDKAYELVQDGKPTGIVELPVEWILDDAPLFNVNGERYSPPREVARVWMDEFDKAHAEGTMFVLTMHPHIIGHRSRIVALELLLDHIRAKAGTSVWYATHGEVAEYVRAQAKLGEPIKRITP